MPEITGASYGKTSVPVLKVVRGAERHEVREMVVDVEASGGTEAAYTDQDNAAVVATDTMKNLVNYWVYTLDFSTPEDLALQLAAGFRKRYPHLPRWRARVTEQSWKRIGNGEGPNPISFAGGGPDQDYAEAETDGEETVLRGGLEGLALLKTTGSAFDDFHRDEFTTLAETRDRILSTVASAWWEVSPEADHGAVRRSVRATLVGLFAELESESVQHLVYEVAAAVLRENPEVEEIGLRLPNRHYFPVDLSPFGAENENTLYLPTEAPHGDIRLTVRR